MKKFVKYLKRNLLPVFFALAVVFGLAGLVVWPVYKEMADFSGAVKLAGSALAGPSSAAAVNLPATYDQPLLIRLTDLALSISPIGALPAEAAAEKNVIKYINGFANTDIVQTRYFNKIKEDIILKSPGHPEVFQYQIDLAPYDYKKDERGNLIFYEKGHSDDDSYIRFVIPAPFMVDADGRKSSTKDVFFELLNNGRLTIKPSAQWLSRAKYPVILDPTVEITVLNVHSSPSQGQNWAVNFTTAGQADLKIIPNDQATVQDDEFISLSCGGEIRQPQILAGDIIFYPDWSCSETATVIHYTKKAGNHTLRFEFGGQIAYAYNSNGISAIVFRSGSYPVCGTYTVLGADGYTYGSVLGADGNCWLDRNLGATQVATALDDSAAYGDHYQWGRGVDGHQISTSGTTATNSSTDSPGHANFITETSSPYDWRVPQNDNLWQGLNGINNPCPTGFRLPTSAEWTALTTAAGITDRATAYSSSLKLPSAGIRIFSNALLTRQSTYGYYWSSNASSTQASYLSFTSSAANPADHDFRANGVSVRCIRDSAPVIFRSSTATCGSYTVQGVGGLSYGTVLGEDGQCWLDRNLGAVQVATSSTDFSVPSVGYMYQWGRLSDGHQITSPLSGTTATNSSTDSPGHANFITEGSTPWTFDWREPQNDNLWQGAASTNNPCPTGWSVPTITEWETLITAASITNAATAYSSSLKLSMAGYRSNTNGALTSRGTIGYYWSSSLYGQQSYFFYFDATSKDTVNAIPLGRAYAFSIRCVQDSNTGLARPVIFRSPSIQPCGASTVCGTQCTYNGDTYSTVLMSATYGSQCWFLENLMTQKKPDGVTGITRYCYGSTNGCDSPWGGLYDWNTAMNGESAAAACGAEIQGICPSGWHIPSDYDSPNCPADDFQALGADGGALRQTGVTDWTSPNTGATNASGWTGYPAGLYSSGSYLVRNNYLYLWSSSEFADPTYAYYRSLYYNDTTFGRGNDSKSTKGASIRCVKN